MGGFFNMYHGDDYATKEKLYWNDSPIIDIALTADEFLGTPLSLTLFGKNILNSKVHVSMTGWPGYTYNQNTSVGLKVSYKL